MAYGIKLEVWGDYALFTRPELKVERYSYDVMTPSAARGILEAIFWKPAIKYVIDRIEVLNEIKTVNVRRNEVKSKIPHGSVKQVMEGSKKEQLYLATSDDIAQRASVILKEVRYVIYAHFELTDKAGEGDNHGKFSDIIRRRIGKGQCFYNPYFGAKEFTLNFRHYETKRESFYQGVEKDLGIMLYDLDYGEEIKPYYFKAVMKNGVIDVVGSEVYR